MADLYSIPFKSLKLGKDNIRKSAASAEEDAQLKTSIAANGILQNLIVRPAGKDKYEVRGGARRYRAFADLVKDKVFPATAEVPCMVLGDNENEIEAAIAENIVRVGMHPIDEFEAFTDLHYRGELPIADIAAHFGTSELHIRQRLALGNVHPTLRALCREGELSVDALRAYAGTDDQERQIAAYTALKQSDDHRWVGSIRKYLRERTYTSDHKLARYIGLAAYKKAGGAVTEDLFEEDRTTLIDGELVETLAKEKLDRALDKARGQWKWAEVDLSYEAWADRRRKLEPEPVLSDEERAELADVTLALDALQVKEDEAEAKGEDLIYAVEAAGGDPDEDPGVVAITDEIEAIAVERRKLYARARELEKRREFTPEQRAIGGCIITLSSNGQLQRHEGILNKEDLPAARQLEAGAAPDGVADTASKSEEADEGQGFSAALTADLSLYHQAAAKADLLYSPALMYRATLFSLCWSALKPNSLYAVGAAPMDIKCSSTFRDSSLGDLRDSRMHQEVLEYRETLDLSWIGRSAADSLSAFLQLPDDEVQRLVAYCGVLSLDENRNLSDPECPLGRLLEISQSRLGKHWQPTAANFFGRIKKAALHKAGAEITGQDDFPKGSGYSKRLEIAEYLQELVLAQPPADRWLPF
ncbi:MAG TPA: ParB N-terminal domain-containing protein [Hyphomicrobiales bacterium]|nr:ParB N-terminal domain-containing protein [Hyphomicrobiales bacterium]